MRVSAVLLTALCLLPSCGRGPRESAPNLVLISIDTLRWDRLGCTGHEGAETPNIDALATRGALFKNAVAPAPLTLPSHATMLTGLLPLEHGLRDNGPYRLDPRFETLAEGLSSRGYATYAVIGAKPLEAGHGLEQGFEHYDDQIGAQVEGSVLLAERPADQVTTAALARLARHDRTRPFFLFVHYFDAHAPYAPPPPYRDRFREQPYDGEVAFLDREVGRLLRELDRGGHLRRSVLVLTADHGDSFGEHGEESHAFFLYDDTIRVPLIVVDALGETAGDRASQVRLQDLRAFFEARADQRPFDLTAPAARGEPALIESLYGAIHCGFAQLRGLRLPGGTKYLESGLEEFYDLESDPHERQDLSARRPGQVEAARSLLARLLNRAGGQALPGPGTSLPGYLSMPADPKLVLQRTREENQAADAPKTRLDSIRALQEGVRFHEQGLFDAASALLEPASRKDPKNPALHFRLGLSLRSAATVNDDRGQLERAVTAFERALALRPGLPGARPLLIHALGQLGRYQEAFELGREALALDAPPSKDLEVLGMLFHTPQGHFAREPNPLYDFQKGIETLERAVRAGSDNPKIQAYLEQCYARGAGR